jgi:hypothetical protein
MTQLERKKHQINLDLTLSKFQKNWSQDLHYIDANPNHWHISLHDKDKVEDVVLLLIIVKILKYSDWDYGTPISSN